ncbi:flavin reductase family protein [Lentzea albidocapillata]|uniref:NADH-FMN oxidoreductase RutF, flavin reductase (DIM6/NTAB) family n=1 Tax=Lentzea albidocapillata TaxID=40571 RepID=A0A1W2BFF1_9PSEU|nr:flavin reductase family protein [Lentzea albidocapillata]SMC71554.1 NADH-FMN oxidoreductase RutF, flavin reductase (DIM6/NTAB) family [Lentzea albidocapillata]
MIIVQSIDDRATVLRQAFACFPSGVTAICALSVDEPVGMAISSFTSVSLDPALLSICVQNTSATWPKLRAYPRLGLSVLAEHQTAAGRRLAMKNGDRFAGVEWQTSNDGALFVLGASAWFDCSIKAEVPAGDHTVVLLEVHGLQAKPDVPPLVFHGSRFRRLEVDELTVGA